jgi:hypothetical protein
MDKVITDYNPLRDAETSTFGKVVIEHMENNEYFPNLEPTPLVLKALFTNYDVALIASANGDRLAITQKNTLKRECVAGLRQWAMYVNTVSQGNADKIASSYFKKAKVRQPVILSAPVIKNVFQGVNPGTLIVTVVNGKGVKSYLYQIAEDPITETTEWESFGDSRKKSEFGNLAQGKKYWIRVIAIGGNGQAIQSSEVAQYVMQRTMAKAA